MNTAHRDTSLYSIKKHMPNWFQVIQKYNNNFYGFVWEKFLLNIKVTETNCMI